MGPDTPLNRSWPGSPRSSACATPRRDSSFQTLSNLTPLTNNSGPARRKHSDVTPPVISGLTPEMFNSSYLSSPVSNEPSERRRRITFHSPLQGLHGYHTAEGGTYGNQTEGPMDFLSKLPARFLNGKSSIEFQHPPEIYKDESISKPEMKQDDADIIPGEASLDPESFGFDPGEMKRLIYEKAFCKQQSYGVEFRKQWKTTEVESGDGLAQPGRHLSVQDSFKGSRSGDTSHRRWSYMDRTNPPPLHPGVSVVSELSPLSPAWYPSPTETPGPAFGRGMPHLPSRFLKAMQTLEQPELADSSPTNESTGHVELTHQNSRDNNDPNLVVRGNELTNQNLEDESIANQNIINNNVSNYIATNKEAINENQPEEAFNDNQPMTNDDAEKTDCIDLLNSSRDTQTMDDTGGDIDIEPGDLVNKVGHNIKVGHDNYLGQNLEQSEEIRQNIDTNEENTKDAKSIQDSEVLEQTALTEGLRGALDNDPEGNINAASMYSQNNNPCHYNSSQSQTKVKVKFDGHNDHLGQNIEPNICDNGVELVTNREFPPDGAKKRGMLLDNFSTQSFELAIESTDDQTQFSGKKSVTLAEDFRKMAKSDTISDVETPRSFLDEESKFHDVFVNSYDQSDPFLEPDINLDQPRLFRNNSVDQSGPFLDLEDSTNQSKRDQTDRPDLSKTLDTDQLEEEVLLPSRWSRNYSRVITKALSRDLSEYEAGLQEEITRPRNLDIIRYTSGEGDQNEIYEQNETYNLRENTQVYKPEILDSSSFKENVELIKDTSQELHELEKELGSLDAGRQEHDDDDVMKERKKSLVDATSVVTHTLTALLKDSLKKFQDERNKRREQAIKHEFLQPEVKEPETIDQEVEPDESRQERMSFNGNVEEIIAVHLTDGQMEGLMKDKSQVCLTI